MRTEQGPILRRLALREGGPYRQDLLRQSEERVAALGVFSSVSITLEDPDIPAAHKRVIVTVSEQRSQYFEPKVGFSTGDGLRFAFEYGHRNIGGLAIALTLRVQLAYLFDFLIFDPTVRANYDALSALDRLERRDTISLMFPEIGLGPLVSLALDTVDVRDNQRDFGLTKEAIVPTLTYRPIRALATQFGISVERNDVSLFDQSAVATAIANDIVLPPTGATLAFAQKAGFTWDFRDNPFNAKKGGLFSASVEHVNAWPADTIATVQSNFLRFTTKVTGYFRLTEKGMVFAMSLAGGYNLQLTRTSQTYPDRSFFLGGVDSLRSFLADAVVPEDLAEKILNGVKKPNGQPWTINDITVRGGDLTVNPRAELRIPITDLFQVGVFLDTGNLWTTPSEVQRFVLRYALGAGLRITTPIGPVALDYGFNLDRRDALNEDIGAFHFSIGLF